MNDADVSKQIQQMVRFIRQEAEEKANEISVSAEEVFLSFFLRFLLLSALDAMILLLTSLILLRTTYLSALLYDRLPMPYRF